MAKYEISFGLQYDAWEMEIRLPDWESYETEAEAEKSSEETMVSALLCADAIFFILPGQRAEDSACAKGTLPFFFFKGKSL